MYFFENYPLMFLPTLHTRLLSVRGIEGGNSLDNLMKGIFRKTLFLWCFLDASVDLTAILPFKKIDRFCNLAIWMCSLNFLCLYNLNFVLIFTIYKYWSWQKGWWKQDRWHCNSVGCRHRRTTNNIYDQRKIRVLQAQSWGGNRRRGK